MNATMLKTIIRPPVQWLDVWIRRHNGQALAQLERSYSLNQLQRMEMVLNRHGYSLGSCSSILEFGCGDGRLVQHLFRLAPRASVSGCDVLHNAVASCQRRYPRGRFLRNEIHPPSPFEPAQFDLIYSYSVFTHLSERNHAAWLKELARLLKPGGLMLHTVHSHACLKRMHLFSPQALRKYAANGSMDDVLESVGDYYYVVEDPAQPEYGHTLMQKEYVLNIWPRYSGLQVIDYVEGAIEAYPHGCQDLVLLTKDRTGL